MTEKPNTRTLRPWGKHRKQCKRWDLPWTSHFLTFSCQNRLPLLGKDRTRGWFLNSLERARHKHGFHLWAWVLMPEHVHMVVYIPNRAKISSILKSIKLPASRPAMLWVRENAPWFLDRLRSTETAEAAPRFWLAGGGHERTLRSPEDVHEKVAYIHDNPVRRGLVSAATDWEWSSAMAHQTGEDVPIALDWESMPTTIRRR